MKKENIDLEELYFDFMFVFYNGEKVHLLEDEIKIDIHKYILNNIYDIQLDTKKDIDIIDYITEGIYNLMIENEDIF